MSIFSEEQKAILTELMENVSKNAHYDIFKNCMGKLVKITHKKYLYGSDDARITYGVVVNITSRQVYIINANGCLEIIRTHDIGQMIETGLK